MPNARAILAKLRRSLVEDNEQELDPVPDEQPAQSEPSAPPDPPPAEEGDPLDSLDPHELGDPKFLLNGSSFYNWYAVIREKFGRRKRSHTEFVGQNRHNYEPPGAVELYQVPGRSVSFGSGETILTSTSWIVWSDGDITLRYHATDILLITPDSKVVVNNGGYYTKNTFSRINQFLPNEWRLASYRDNWYWYNRRTRIGTFSSKMLIEFTSDDMLTPDGYLHPKQEPITGLRLKKEFPAWELRQ